MRGGSRGNVDGSDIRLDMHVDLSPRSSSSSSAGGGGGSGHGGGGRGSGSGSLEPTQLSGALMALGGGAASHSPVAPMTSASLGAVGAAWSRVSGARAPIFEWYDVELPLPDDGNFRSTCKICKTSISASRRATSNLISHMKRKHPGVYADNATQRFSVKSERPLSQGSGDLCSTPSGGRGADMSSAATISSSTCLNETPSSQHHHQSHHHHHHAHQHQPQQQPQQPQQQSQQQQQQAHACSTENASDTSARASIASIVGGGAGSDGMAPVEGTAHQLLTGGASQGSALGTHGGSVTATAAAAAAVVAAAAAAAATTGGAGGGATGGNSAGAGGLCGGHMGSGGATAATAVDGHSRAVGALVDFLANSLMDPRIVDSIDFRHFVHVLNPTFELPSSLHLSYSFLPSKRWALQQRLMQLLQGVDFVAITQDVWTSRSQQSVACLSAHFVHDWKLKMVFLSSKHFLLPDIKTNLAELFEDTVSYYNLSQKVSHTLTNNATKLMQSAKTSLSGFLPEDFESAADQVYPSDTGATLDLRDMNSIFLEGMGCLAEAIESCVAQATKDNLFLECALSKVSAIVDYIRTIVFPSPALEELRIVMERGYSTWNLQLRIIRAIVSTSHERLQNALSGVKSLNHEDYAVLGELIDLLEPFEEAYNLYRDGHKVTASYVIPCIRGLKMHLQNVKAVHLGSVVDRLSRFLQTSMAKYEANETYALCSMLDPRFKLAWCPEERQCSLITLLCRKASDQHLVDGVVSSNTSAFTGEERKSKLFQYMSPPQASTRANSVHSVEVGSYLATPCLPDSAASCPLEFWRQNQAQYPSLCQLARSLMNIPASASHVLQMSRLQSSEDVINLAELTNLNAATFESLMFVKVNRVSLLR